MRDALACEARPHGQGSRVSTIPVYVDGRYTLAATGDWRLSVAMLAEAIR